MNLKYLVPAMFMAMALSFSVVAGTIVIKEPQVRTIVTAAGYGEPILIEKDGELWMVKSVDLDRDAEVTLFVDQEGRVLGAADVIESRISEKTTTTTTIVQTLPEPLTESSVATIVMNAGFHNVHDIDFIPSRGVWKAEADDITGQDYELHVNPDTGLIVHIEDD